MIERSEFPCTVELSATVLPGAEELEAQRCSLAPVLIFSIPADLRSYLQSKRLAIMQHKAQCLLHTFHIELYKLFLLSNF